MKIFDSSKQYPNHLVFIPFVVEQLGIKKMAEIGVLHGALSIAVLDNCPGIKAYYLVDPWKPFMKPPAYSQKIWDRRYEAVKDRMKQYDGRAHILRLTSLEAADRFGSGSLDIVYLDANHSFKHVDEDIKVWWPKICPTGYLAGHDLIDQWPGVRQAVETNFGCQYYCGDPSKNWDGTWIISKEETEILG